MAEDFTVKALLLVEDSENDIILTQRKLFKSVLKITEFIIAKSLTEAKKILREKEIEIVLLDLNLPESRGVDTVVEIRKEFKGIIIVVTSIDDEFTGLEAIKQGADDYVVKSTMTDVLIARAILFARQRRKTKALIHSAHEKLTELSRLTEEDS